ncbi:Zinc finger, C3HC4 RING-type [Penicillium camemberti]|uniref:Zinc finger, C3HC4 RING-type n=1 Tax=Penicillium camemberti (strain FM 013) TaxID=1429867 RepID=A0A0G4NZY2_PENC3|nr:Zinc finger, C3HC4 RING-type [Penicillium camemberti]
MPCYVGSQYAKDDECSLCFEDMTPDSIFRQLPCRHIFHQPCIDKWLCKRDASCPLCRQTFYHLRPSVFAWKSAAIQSHNGDNVASQSRGTFVHRCKRLLHLES